MLTIFNRDLKMIPQTSLLFGTVIKDYRGSLKSLLDSKIKLIIFGATEKNSRRA